MKAKRANHWLIEHQSRFTTHHVFVVAITTRSVQPPAVLKKKEKKSKADCRMQAVFIFEKSSVCVLVNSSVFIASDRQTVM